MTTTIRMWGNSHAVRLPKALLDDIDLANGAELEVTTDGESVTLRPVRQPRRPMRKYTLEELVADQPEHPDTDECVEVDWGSPVGREVW